MHEVSIAFGMIDEVTRIARANNAKKVMSVNLKIGKMSGIVTDSLKFAFDAIKLEHPLLSDTEIFIEEVPLIYECKNCKNSFKTDDIYFPSCPGCKSYSLKLISGEEMNIENLEVEV
jgi:hydrogenase nickel incorporation protein HypA/HybF